MFEFLDRLRQKPLRYRKYAALSVAALVAGVILVVWFTTVYPTILADHDRDARVAATQPSPLGALSANLANGYKALTDQMNTMPTPFTSPTVSSSTEASSTASSTSDDIPAGADIDDGGGQY